MLIGGGRTFIAGADIKEFGKITSGREKRGIGLLPLLLAIEDCPKPVVAAIHGTAFGGGLEVAMACHYRVAVPSAQVGQPEVKLGIIPGAARHAAAAAAGRRREGRRDVRVRRARQGRRSSQLPASSTAVIEGDLLAGGRRLRPRTIAEAKRPPRRATDSDKLGDARANAPIFAAAATQARKTGAA